MPFVTSPGTANVLAAFRVLTQALDASKNPRGLAWACAMRLLDQHGLVGVVPDPDDDAYLDIALRHIAAAKALVEHERDAQRNLLPAAVDSGDDAPF